MLVRVTALPNPGCTYNSFAEPLRAKGLAAARRSGPCVSGAMVSGEIREHVRMARGWCRRV
eukprot:2701876-Alexandrium_andersonii.AAC.1